MAAKVLYAYASTESDELILRKNEVLDILEKVEEDWWRCRNSAGEEGMAPRNYLEVLAVPAGWTTATDQESGDQYYYNAESGVTQWEFPLDPPPSSLQHNSPAKEPQPTRGPLQSKAKDSGSSHPGAGPTSPAGRTEGLPLGWAAFTDQETGDEYYHHAASGETSWERPKHRNEKSAPLFAQPGRGDSGSDLSSLRRMQEEAAAKMAALRDAINNDDNAAPENIDSSALDFGVDTSHVSSHNSLPAPNDSSFRSSKQTNSRNNEPKNTSKNKSKSSLSNKHSSSNFANISMDEINKMIDDRVQQELKKREEEIMAQVEAMMLAKFSKHDSNDSDNEHEHVTPAAVAENKRKKKKKQQQAVRESQQLSSRSAESGKTAGQSRLLTKATSQPDLLHPEQEQDRESAFSPIQPLQPFEVSQGTTTETNHQSNDSSIAASTNDSLFPELRTGNAKGPVIESPQKSSKKPTGGRKKSAEEVSFPPIVKPERVPLHREPTEHFEDFESAALNTIIPNDEEEASVARHKDEAEGNLTLKHVHAYDGSGGTGKNIHWLSRSVIAFPAVALVVLMNVNNSKQQFYKGHTNEVTSLSIHPDKKIIASGQIGKEGRILVWDSSLLFQKKREGDHSPAHSPTKRAEEVEQIPDMNILKELSMEKTKGILGVDFSGDGRLLVTIGMHESNPVTVFDWSRGVALAHVTLGHTEIYQIGFNQYLYNNQGDVSAEPLEKKFCYSLVSCGSRSVKFWSLRRICEQVGAGAAVKKGKGGFKGRQLAVPKNKQKWEWKHTLDGNTGNIPKKQSATAVEMTCFSAIAEPFVEGKHKLPQSKVLTGASNGCVNIWQQLEVSVEGADDDGYMYWLPRGSLLCVVSDVHDGPIFDLDYFHSGSASLHRVATCSKDGTVNLWELDSSNPTGATSPMQHLSVVNVSGSDGYLGHPRSITYNADGKALVVGTNNNCICTLAGAGVNMQGTEGGEASVSIRLHNVVSSNYGKGRHVAPHPFMDMCATVASDKTLRLWSVKAAAQVAYTRISGCGSSLTFTPDGSSIAIGTETGEVLILTCTYLQFCRDNDAEPGADQKKPRWDILGRKFVGVKGGGNAKKDVSKTEITALKYSPSGNVLAVATRDKIIHLLSAVSGYKRTAACKGHSGAIASLDFSDDGVLLQASDCVRETLFWEVATGKLMSDVARAQASRWDSWANLLGPSMQGVCNGSNPSDPRNHVEPSAQNLTALVEAAGRSNDCKSLVVAGAGQTFRQHCLKLFKNPCTAAAVSKEYTAHSSGIGDTCFLNSDRYVVSMGGNDKSLLVWVHR